MYKIMTGLVRLSESLSGPASSYAQTGFVKFPSATPRLLQAAQRLPHTYVTQPRPRPLTQN